MNKKYLCKKNIIVFFFAFTIVLTGVIYAGIIDKQGREVYEITKPTASPKVDEDMISDAIRRKTDVFSGKDATKNISAEAMIIPKDMIVASSSNIDVMTIYMTP